MASTDTRLAPVKGVALRIPIGPFYDKNGNRITGWTSADSQISKDDGSFTDCTNEAVEKGISGGGDSGRGYLDLTSTELGCDAFDVIVFISNTDAEPFDYHSATERAGGYLGANVQENAGVAITSASGIPEVKVASIATDAVNAASVKADAVTKIQAGLATPTNITAGVITTVTNLTNAATAGDLTSTMRTSAASAVWNALTSGITTSGSVGKRLLDLFTGITSLAQWLGLIAGKQTGDATALTEIKATGAGSGTYNPTTDSTEAIRDRGDAAWGTATGFAVPGSQMDLVAVPNATAVTAIQDGLATGTALADVDSDLASIGSIALSIAATTGKLADTLEDQGGGVYGFTAAALQEAPTGGGTAPSAEAIAAQVRTELAAELDLIDVAVSTRGTGVALDASGVRDAIGLGSANLDTQLGALGDYPSIEDIIAAAGGITEEAAALLNAADQILLVDLYEPTGLPALVIPAPDPDESLTVCYAYTENISNEKRAGIVLMIGRIGPRPAKTERILETSNRSTVTDADGYAQITLQRGLTYSVTCPDLGLKSVQFTPQEATFDFLTLVP